MIHPGRVKPQMTETEHSRIQVPAIVIELCVGIIVFSAVCELVGVWFVQDKAAFSIGLWLGCVLSCLCSYHIWALLDRSLDLNDEKTAARKVGTGYVIRYIALILLIVVLYFTRIGSPFAAFLGYIGMKPAAYIQPAVHKISDRLLHRR